MEKDCTHAYYVYPILLEDELLAKVSRERIVEALEAEGVDGLANGFANIHMLPMYQNKIAYGSKGFPWTSDINRREITYGKGVCPTAEYLHEYSVIGYEMCLHQLRDPDVDLIAKAFEKVWDNLEELT